MASVGLGPFGNGATSFGKTCDRSDVSQVSLRLSTRMKEDTMTILSRATGQRLGDDDGGGGG